MIDMFLIWTDNVINLSVEGRNRTYKHKVKFEVPVIKICKFISKNIVIKKKIHPPNVISVAMFKTRKCTCTLQCSEPPPCLLSLQK